ncbi:MAG TPA: PqqD family protein [Planctomycetota bacterium]|jgi:hypothetical protein
MKSPWVRSADVVWEELDGQAVLVSTRTRKTWVLNAAGSFIWRCCDGSITLDDIVRRLAGSRSADIVRQEAAAFIAQLEQRGLLRTAPRAAVALAGNRGGSFCYSGAMPPLITLETTSFGARRGPSPRNVSGPP